ncbi:glycoside hydrolase family 18 [Prevotella sp. KH2C16]|uniref:glycoside hydrolase family 18 n=1 Tax=Prevotella sp. KH2C16 TaxID=1855325 RepID=UPI000B882D48|nr:glycoside hydrolase family 18 [Prevotella sp. KH2C16]
MKNIFKSILFVIGAVMGMASCSDWTDMETQNPSDLTANIRSEAYYAQLRDYKKSDHPVAFGWFGGWAGRDASLEKSLSGLPDSVDFVSLWGNFKNLTQAQKEDLEYVQKVKGTKVLICWQVHDIGDQLTPDMPEGWAEQNPGKDWRHEFWGWGDSKEEKLAATEKYAKAILDTINKYNYDGFDIDAEYGLAQIGFTAKEELWRNEGCMDKFVETLAAELGPHSGTDKMLVVDGKPEDFDTKYADYFNYFILQAYDSDNFLARPRNTQARFDRQLSYWKSVLTPEQLARKIIITCNYENGGNITNYSYIMAEGMENEHLYDGLLPKEFMTWQKDNKRWVARVSAAFALFNPVFDGKTYRKGGMGTYHMEYEYKADGTINTYPNLRMAIQIMNPTNK